MLPEEKLSQFPWKVLIKTIFIWKLQEVKFYLISFISFYYLFHATNLKKRDALGAFILAVINGR